MSKFIDMTGWIMAEHGVPDSRLTVLKRVDDKIASNGRKRTQWLCECSCVEHNRIVVFGDLVRIGKAKSCGCLKKETGNGVKKSNIYELNINDEYGIYGIGYCSNTCEKFYFDMDDYDTIKDYCWYEDVGNDGYHRLRSRNRNGKGFVLMSHLIVGKYYDHIDRNPLNNRRHNLRPANYTENARNHNKQSNNTSGIIGVSWHSRDCVWQASIVLNKKKIYLGYFNNKNDAIKTRLIAEAKYFGEFAPQKHLFEQYKVLTIQN